MQYSTVFLLTTFVSPCTATLPIFQVYSTATFSSVQRLFRVYSDVFECTATFPSVQQRFWQSYPFVAKSISPFERLDFVDAAKALLSPFCQERVYSDISECTATFSSVQRHFRVYSDISECTATFPSEQRPFPVYSDVSDNLIILLLKVFRLLKDMTLQTKAQLCRQSFLYK